MLIVIVNNGPFEAAAIAYSESEFLDFTGPSDNRPKEYIIMDKAKAYELTRY